MANLAEIIRKQRSSGSSRTGALFSSVGMKVLESVDPRRIFNRSGLLTALFPLLKSYKASGSSDKSVTSATNTLNSSSAPLLQEMIIKLDNLSIISNITAKNSQALPGISRDMNIMRQNVVKLVKLQGGKASTRADGFFLRASERERATEAQLQAAKERRETGKASAVTSIKEGASSIPGLGLILSLVGALKTIGQKIVSSIGSLTEMIGPLLKGGLSLLLDFGKGAANLAIKGGLTLFDLAKKIPFGTMIRGLLSFISGAGGLALLGVGGAAAILEYLINHEKTQKGDAYEGPPPDAFEPAPPRPPAPSPTPSSSPSPSRIPGNQDPASYEELLQARKSLRQSNPSAAAQLDAFSPLPETTSPTPVPNKSVTPGPDGELLDFIASKESGGDYNAVYGRGSVPGLTNMTLSEVLDYQKRLIASGQKSSAVGRYQFIRSTLEEEIKKSGVDINKEKFTPAMQDKLILNRLKRIRGLDKYRQGKISREEFAENLSMEFASMPSPRKGKGTKSYYEGIAGNKSLTSMDSVYAAIAPKTTSSQLSNSIEESRSLATSPAAAAPNNVVINDNKVLGGSSAPIVMVDKATPYDRSFYNGLIGDAAL
jgi:muramidase (phage lysozyme)